MRRVIVSLAAALVIAGAVSFSVVPSAAPRLNAGESVFLIPPSDGYGVAECLIKGGDCGRIVANAWCESKGFARAAAFGVVSPTELTGSISARVQTSQEPPLAITCTDNPATE